MQQMLNICDTYANDHGLMFSSKKSNTITFVKSSRRLLAMNVSPLKRSLWPVGRGFLIWECKDTRNGSSTG